MTPRVTASERDAASVAELLGETLHEMQCRRRHPHPVDYSWGMQGEQLAAALTAHPTPPPPLDAQELAEMLHELEATQHYVTHETSYDGDDMEGVACIGGPSDHADDASDLLSALAERGYGLSPAATPSPDAGELRALSDLRDWLHSTAIRILSQRAETGQIGEILIAAHVATGTADQVPAEWTLIGKTDALKGVRPA